MLQMKSLIRRLQSGQLPSAVKAAAKNENVSVDFLVEGLLKGSIVVPANPNHGNLDPIGIGKGLRVKVNANLGTSPDCPHAENELKKLQAALDARTDTVMDLSTGGDLNHIRSVLLKESTVPLGTVPIYQAGIEARIKRDGIVKMTADDIFEVIERQGRQGVDFITVHCGVTQESLERLRRHPRIMDVVSRGGSFLVGWMIFNQKENPLYEQYDRLLEIAAEYEMTLSLGDGFRPGCLADSTDRSQIQELITLGELVDRAHEAGVQAMVEGPGHVPFHEIETNMKIQQSLCRKAPFYVLGPIVTDIAPGYDHMTSAIGGTLAAVAGADYLCYVTPSEHLGLPEPQDVKEGVIASRIAAHAADIAKGIPGAAEWDTKMARARKELDWDTQMKLAINPQKVKEYREVYEKNETNVCSMCGDYCAVKLISEYFNNKNNECDI